ncbi:hypothetical protein [Burkholderia sp. Ac-20353]|uniref:hypothetical protein n=1 Tax=Burkholderia sp. Ac-20353 TaxID=2703894 RepID=UPI00197C68C5|nr:hypothetical protein [Burkholderia sp. Ac-20353]MBN3790343.1 hypothetical protein [Burkholderia sp. Ac-20353]
MSTRFGASALTLISCKVIDQTTILARRLPPDVRAQRGSRTAHALTKKVQNEANAPKRFLPIA